MGDGEVGVGGVEGWGGGVGRWQGTQRVPGDHIITQDRWRIETPDQAHTVGGFLLYLFCSSSVTDSFAFY